MTEQNIECPYCKKSFPLNESISAQINQKVKENYEKKLEEEKHNILENVKKETEEKYILELSDLKAQVGENKQKMEKFRKADLEFKRKVRELEEKDKGLENEIEKRLHKEIKDFETKLNKENSEKIIATQKKADQRIKEIQEKLKTSQEKEVEYLRLKDKMEDEKRKFELKTTKTFLEEKEKLRQETKNQVQEEYKLKDREKDQKLQNHIEEITELKRKLEQGSQQIQGDVAQFALHEILENKFYEDTIEMVPRGKQGADVLQRVRDAKGNLCGTIIWESKNTKVWNKAWIDKLNQDKRVAKAELAGLVSAILPKGSKSLDYLEGVWISNNESVLPLAIVLRSSLIEIYRRKQAATGANKKMELLYNYLTGTEFRQRVEANLEAYRHMREDLEKEKRVIMKNWSKREKQLSKMTFNTVQMYGDMEGIIGASMPQIDELEYKALTDGNEEES